MEKSKPPPRSNLATAGGRRVQSNWKKRQFRPVSGQFRANGLWGSLAMTSQSLASDWIEKLCQAANAAPVFLGRKLFIYPYSEVSTAGNGATYTAPTAAGPIAHLDADNGDFVGTDGCPKLKTVDRPWVINAIAEARAQGDLSENAEYEAAKDRQGFIEGRIQEIEGKLAAAQVIDPAAVEANGKVVFGATVELEDEDSGDKVKYQIVGEDEADLKQGLINISSPIARALIGKEEGDTAEVQAPGGLRRYEIVAVHYL